MFFCKQLIKRHFLKKANADFLEDFVERFLNAQLLFLDGDDQIHGYRNPDLGANRILTGAVKCLDPQMLFDQLEKEFDLPAVFIQQSNGLGAQGKVVGQENQKAFVFRIVNSNSAQWSGIILLRIEVGEGDSLIADDVACNGIRFMAGMSQVIFGPNHKEGTGLIDFEKPLKIHIATIHQIDRTRLPSDLIHPVDFMRFSIGNMDLHGDRTLQIQLGVKLDRRFGFAKPRPGKQAQAKVDGGGVDGVNGFSDLQSGRIIDIKFPGFADQDLSEVVINSPVSTFIGFRQGAATNRRAKSQMLQIRPGPQAVFNIPKTLPIRELGKPHRQPLVPTTKTAHLVMPSVLLDTPGKLRIMNRGHDLGKNAFSFIHSLRIKKNLHFTKSKNSSRPQPNKVPIFSLS